MVNDIEEFKNKVEEKDGVELGVENSGGYEIRVVNEKHREWLVNFVSENSLEFNNRNRIESGHNYFLVLPDNSI
jgi:hypothetical protein